MVTHSRRASKHDGRGRVLPNHLQARTRELGRTSSWTATWTATRAAGSGSPAGSCRVHADPFGACPAGTGERGDESARSFETGRRAHGGGEPRLARTGCWSQRPGRASGLTQRFPWFFEAPRRLGTTGRPATSRALLATAPADCAQPLEGSTGVGADGQVKRRGLTKRFRLGSSTRRVARSAPSHRGVELAV